MTDTCTNRLPYKAVGPYNQTLFLGCSITNFNISLGWGGEASTLTVNLLDDRAYHPSSAVFASMENRLVQINTQSQSQSNASNALKVNPTTGDVETDNTKTMHRTISQEMENQERSRFSNNKRLYDNPQTTDNQNIIDNGKVCWSSAGTKKFWTDPDLGFLGLPNKFNNRGYDIIGTPVLFKFDDLFFGGMIYSWKNVGSQGGWPTYEVEIRSFASLLNGSQLIIDGYAGTVASLVGNTSDNPTGLDVCVPHSYLRLPGGNSALPYNGSIVQGNLPNVFNIYGHLEADGFGNSGRTDRGISALAIYNALVSMLGPGTDESHSPFNPYGALLGRTITDMDGNSVDPYNTIYRPSLTNPNYQLSLHDIGICRNRVPVVAANGATPDTSFRRSMFKLDLSQVPAPPAALYMQGPTISIMQFLTEICDGAGVDFFIDFIPASGNDDYAGTIKVRTVSRRVQPNREIIKNIVDNLISEHIQVSSYNYGQEFNDQNTRVMYVGGKQKRLLQVKSTPLASKQNTLIFDPFANDGLGSFIDYSALGQPGTNQVREPNLMSTRSYRYRMAPGGGAVVAESQTKENFPAGGYSDGSFADPTYFADAGSSLLINRGNYHDAKNIQTIQTTVALPMANHPYYTNMISPYFGVGANGLGRKVFFDPAMGQMQIIFDVKDITDIVSATTPGYDGFSSNSPQFMVLENELRAASKGLGEWMVYCFNSPFTTDIEELTYKIFRQSFGPMGSREKFFDVKSFVILESISKFNQINQGRPHRVNLNSAAAYMKIWYKNFEAIHQFFQKIASEYYGKQFMIKMPSPRWYEDSSILPTETANINTLLNTGVSNTITIRQGSGKIYTDWELSPDGAWEEPGNLIDDMIYIGSPNASMMMDEQGKIPPIIGYNASAEYDYKQMYLGRFYAAQASISNAVLGSVWGNYIDLIRFEVRNNARDHFYSSINHSLPSNEYITLPYNNAAARNLKTAHGQPLNGNNLSKMYVKSSLSSDIVFLDFINGNYAEPRAIMTISSPVFIGANRNTTDNQLDAIQRYDSIAKYTRGSSIPTPAIGIAAGNTIWGGLRWKINPSATTYRNIVAGTARAEASLYGTSSNPDDPSSANVHVLEKAAVPSFAAIPIQSNLAIYGPWINHPGSIAAGSNGIFSGRVNPYYDVNNLIGGSKVNIDEGLVPWNYGGMDALDSAVLEKIFEDVNYQQINEQGSIQVPGYMLTTSTNGSAYNVGDALQYLGVANGPIVSNIQVQVGEGGITTSYNMRTYVRKLGFFNKENSDRMKLIGQEAIKRRKEIATSIATLTQKLGTGSSNGFGSMGADEIYDVLQNHTSFPAMLRTSPLTVLAGQAYPNVNHKSSLTDLQTQLGYSPSWNMLPASLDSSISYTPEQMIKQLTYSSLYDVEEVPKELVADYHKKSFMSLDGLLSPISFYPTEFSATYHATKYPTEACPFCKGTRRYKYTTASDTNLQSTLASNGNCQNIMSLVANSRVTMTEDCRFCEPTADKVKRSFISASSKETTPPYVIASGDDLTLVNNLRFAGLTGNPIINQNTLNPILTSLGEFSCFQNRQVGDLTAHSIEIIGDGLTPPENKNFMQLPYSDNINKRYSAYDLKLVEFSQSHPNLNIDQNFAVANNMKFFGLRGPLMVHGWGYDLEGYPVPNSSGEPKIENGQIVRDTAGNIIYKNQELQFDGTWTKPYKENTFYKGWGQLPGTWPVGPVDLRWDAKAGVWTVGANYKSVWIQIETDLIENQPVRGVMVEDASNEVLPDGLRKLVFVKDNLGINPAPRGAQIYCRYDSQNGFYEPIYNKPYITSGIIQNATAANIYKIYDTSLSRYSTTYKNPLGFNVSNGDIGLFIFMDKNWTLQSVRS